MLKSRARNFCFTRNNYKNTELEDTIECNYIVYGKEVGECGTPHLQGFISFKNARTLSSAIKLLDKAHVEISRTLFQAIDYCKKSGNFTERGTMPLTQEKKGEAEQNRWKDIREAAEEGRLDDIPEKIRFFNKRLIEDHRYTFLKQRKLEDTETRHLWYYGASGTGKSRQAREQNPEAYLKMCNKWWDGYTDEEVVIIEDLDKRHDVLGHHLKIWGDRYPFLAEVKGGAFKIRPKLIIVTSNYSPEEIWQDNPTLEPILRRFKKHRFDQLKTTHKV